MGRQQSGIGDLTLDLDRFVESLEIDEPETDGPPSEEPQYLHGSMRTLRQCDPPSLDHIVGTPLVVARQTIHDAMRTYMMTENPSHILLIPAPPGTGKTWAGVDFAHWAHAETGKRIMYAGPRHDFFTDIVEASASQGQRTADWYEWLPRQNDDLDDSLHTCNYAGQINKWLARGYTGMDFCSQVCGWEYVNKGCTYHAQKGRRNPLIYGQHAHVALGHPMMEQFEVIIGDENPMGTFVHEWLIPKRWIVPSGMNPTDPLAEVLFDMAQLSERGAKLHGADLMNQLGPQRVIEACESFVMPTTALVIAPKLRNADQVDEVGYHYLPELVQKLNFEAMAAAANEPSLERLWLDERGLTIETRRHVNEQAPDHIIWFDATGKSGLYEQMFERDVEVVDVRPQLTGRIYQIVDRANGKGSLLDENNHHTHGVAQIKAQVDAIASKYENPAVITFQQLADAFDQGGTHFYGSRGTNSLQDCDCLIVAGTPQPPLFQIEKVAKCLWHHRWRPFDGAWYTQLRSYNFIDDDGNGWEYPISQYGDPELNEILWQYREAEIIQSAHRARILFRDVPVYLLTNIPIDELPPTQLLTIRELLGAPDAVDVFKWSAIAQWCEGLDYIDARQLVDEFGIDKKTALKYLDTLKETGEWECGEAIRRKGARGPRPKALHRKTVE